MADSLEIPFNKAWQTLNDLVENFYGYSPFIIIGLIVFLLFCILSQVAKKFIREIGKRTSLDTALANVLAGLTSILIIILGVLVAAVIIFPTFSPGNLFAGLGITSVAIGFAFKDIFQNLFAGILILWRKPFRVGDQINTQGYEGTVEDINVRSTYIKTYSGERVVIPNGSIYTEAIKVNTAFNKRRVNIVIGIGYGDSIKKARTIIENTLHSIEGVLKDPGPWVYVDELASSSVNFNIYFWTEPLQANVLKVKDQVISEIKYALDEAGIDIPYPHNVVFLHNKDNSHPKSIKEQNS